MTEDAKYDANKKWLENRVDSGAGQLPRLESTSRARALPITITPVLNGFIVQVGCKQIVFTSIMVLCDEIHAYYTDPVNTTRIYLENAINK